MNGEQSPEKDTPAWVVEVIPVPDRTGYSFPSSLNIDAGGERLSAAERMGLYKAARHQMQGITDDDSHIDPSLVIELLRDYASLAARAAKASVIPSGETS